MLVADAHRLWTEAEGRSGQVTSDRQLICGGGGGGVQFLKLLKLNKANETWVSLRIMAGSH